MKKSKDVLSRSFLRQYGNMILMAPFGVITMVVDSFFIGRSFGELSGTYLSSVGLIAPINMLFFLVADVLSAGIRGPVSREIGKGDKKQANAILSAGVLAGLTASLVILVLGFTLSDPIAVLLGAVDRSSALYLGTLAYLRGFLIGVPGLMLIKLLMPLLPLDSDIKRTGAATAVMAIVDIAMDAVNVFLVKGGMFGMALASSISFYAALCVLLPHFFSKRANLRLERGEIRMRDIKTVLHFGIPSGMTNALFTVQSFTLNHALLYAGGEIALLGNSVISTLGALFCSANTSLGSTVNTMAGISTGEEDPGAIRRLRKTALFYGTIGNAVFGLLLIALSVPLTHLLVPSVQSAATVARFVRYYGSAIVIMSVNCYFQSYFEGSGQQKLTTVFALFYSGIVPIGLYLLTGFGIRNTDLVFLCNPLTQVVTWCVLCVLASRRKGSFASSCDDYLFLPDDFGPAEDDEMNFYIRNAHQVQVASTLAEDFVIDRGGGRRKATLVSLAVEEMGMNIVEHGLKKNGGAPMINVRLVKNKEGFFSLSIRDDCRYFDPTSWLEKAANEGGLGIRMVAALAQDFEYVHTVDTNHLIVKI